MGWPFGDTSIPGVIFDQHYYGPLLCYTLGKKKWEVMDISLYNDINDGDVCIFCFGEIDCRCHIKKHITEENTYQNIIDSLVINYLETVRENIEKAGKKVSVFIYNVVPPSKESEVSYTQPEFPFDGTDEERKSYTLYFNKKLKELCPKFGYTFFDVYNKYTTKDGFLNRELADANVHIRDGQYLLQFIKENIINDK
jgi:hypothetical protein